MRVFKVGANSDDSWSDGAAKGKKKIVIKMRSREAAPAAAPAAVVTTDVFQQHAIESGSWEDWSQPEAVK